MKGAFDAVAARAMDLDLEVSVQIPKVVKRAVQEELARTKDHVLATLFHLEKRAKAA